MAWCSNESPRSHGSIINIHGCAAGPRVNMSCACFVCQESHQTKTLCAHSGFALMNGAPHTCKQVVPNCKIPKGGSLSVFSLSYLLINDTYQCVCQRFIHLIFIELLSKLQSSVFSHSFLCEVNTDNCYRIYLFM